MGGKWRYGVILDAGSSGTRVHIYRWLDSVKAQQKATGKQLKSLPVLETKKEWTKKIRPGISTFGETPTLVGPEHLDELLSHALEHIPGSAVPDTPIFLLATAGVRLLPDRQREALLGEVCKYARKTTKFLLPDCDLHIQAIPGETEGLYGWIAANYLLGGFDSPEEHDHGKGHHTYGFLDMGGASAQIAFAPNATEAEKHAKDLKLLRMRTLDGSPKEHKVFVTTWLRFGVNEARKRYVEALRLATAHGEVRELPDPCLPKGLTLSLDGNHVNPEAEEKLKPGMVDDTVKPLYLLGTGRFDECVRQTYPLLDKDAPCPDAPCLLHGVHVPAIDFDVNHFVGVSEYWHTTHEVFEMGHKDKSYDFNTYQKRVEEFCSQDWETIKNGVAKKKWGKKVTEKTVQNVCFKASWIINVLHEGIGIPRVGIEDTHGSGHNGTKEVIEHAKNKGYLDAFQAVDKVSGVEVSWTLGKMVLYAASQIPGSSQALAVGFGSNVPGIPVDFQYASSTVSPTHNVTHGYDDGVPDEDDLEWHDTLFNSDSPRRIPGFLLFMFILGLAVFLLLGRERRARLYHRINRKFGRSGGFRSRKGGKFFSRGGSGSGNYERLMEGGEAPGGGFELGDVDDELNHSDSSDSSRAGRSSGWATPRLKAGFGGTVSANGNGSGFFGDVVAQGQGLGLGPPAPGIIVENAMDRSGLVVRTESRERLASPSGHLRGGRKSRTGSPRRGMGKSPFVGY